MTVTEDTADDHGGHHLPAVEDWPQGFGEASWWPFITSVGAAGFYVAAALWLLGARLEGVVPELAGPVSLIGATTLFLVGLYGWVYHAFVVGFWSRDTGPTAASKFRWGMLLFLGTEIATFGAGFVYYFFIRVRPWDPGALPPNLLGSLVFLNTLLLVTSSVTLHYSHVALRRDNRTRFIRLLGTTILLGAVFIAGQAYEYYEFIVAENFNIWATEGLEQIFASAFYGLTGLHGLHVTMGAVLLGIVFVRAFRGQYSADRHVSVSTVTMYWHFVDAVWLFLVITLYVGATL
ncbi:MAG: cytochrome c oxidase subunit 3 [Halobacteriales archaeon]|jgi:cytochrome c oxidase subunit 3